MSIKLKGATSGSIELDVPAAVSGGDISLTLPDGVGSAGQYLRNSGTAGTLEFANGGKVLQVVSNYTRRAAGGTSDVLISKTASATAAPALYGFDQDNRAYADIETLTITPLSSTSTLILMGSVGPDTVTRSDRGAEGIVFVKDDTTGYGFGSYPKYDPTYLRTSYSDEYALTIPVASGSTTSQTWDLKAYSYNEASGSATNVYRVRNSSFIIMEVES